MDAEGSPNREERLTSNKKSRHQEVGHEPKGHQNAGQGPPEVKCAVLLQLHRVTQDSTNENGIFNTG